MYIHWILIRWKINVTGRNNDTRACLCVYTQICIMHGGSFVCSNNNDAISVDLNFNSTGRYCFKCGYIKKQQFLPLCFCCIVSVAYLILKGDSLLLSKKTKDISTARIHNVTVEWKVQNRIYKEKQYHTICFWNFVAQKTFAVLFYVHYSLFKSLLLHARNS